MTIRTHHARSVTITVAMIVLATLLPEVAGISLLGTPRRAVLRPAGALVGDTRCSTTAGAVKFTKRTVRTTAYMICNAWMPVISAEARLQRQRWWGWEDVASDQAPSRLVYAKSVGDTAVHRCRSGRTYTYRGIGEFAVQWDNGLVSRQKLTTGLQRYTCP